MQRFAICNIYQDGYFEKRAIQGRVYLTIKSY